ncbi:hypothetical protein ENUP19_0346G0022 [Entamoeba nuttalli]
MENYIIEYLMREVDDIKELNSIQTIKRENKIAKVMMNERRKNKLECCQAGKNGLLVFGYCTCKDTELLVLYNKTIIKLKIPIGIGEFSRFVQVKERGILTIELRKKDILIVGIQNVCLERYWGISFANWISGRIEIHFANRVLEDCWISLWLRSIDNELLFIKKKRMMVGVKVYCFDGKNLKKGMYCLRLHVKQFFETELVKEIYINSPYISSYDVIVNN